MGVTYDTSALIDVLRADKGVLREADRLEEKGLLPILSTVAVFEVLSGVEFTKSRLERARLEALLSSFQIEPFDREAARKAAELRAELLRAGRGPGAPDVMIAGQALSRGHTLVTRDRNLGDVAKASGLSVIIY
jgi:tRNA(fMet)-specific endonuclease VapC